MLTAIESKQNQVAICILCCVCPWVWGHLGVWGELASHKDSLTHCPSSLGWAPECPLGSVLYVYFVLLPRIVSGSGLPFFLPYIMG